jgi:O-antigen/teichoic acid export membrane protein
MGIVQKDAFRTMLISYVGIVLGYVNKGILFLIILTTEQIGLVNLIISVGTLFAQFANMGTIYTTWKFLPFFKNEEKKHHGFLPLILLIVFAGIILCTTLALVFRPQIESMYLEHSAMFVSYYLWFLPIGISYVLYLVLEMYLRSFYKNIVPVIAYEIVLRIAVTVLLALIYFKLISFDLFVILHSLLYLIPTAILLVYLYQLGELNLHPSSIKISKRFRTILIQFSAFNYINTLGVVLVGSMDVIMIAQMIGLEGTGVYTTVIFLTSALQVPYKSILRVSSPLVSDYWKFREFGKMQALYQKVSSVGLVLGLGLFCGIWNNIDFLFSFLKPEFQAGIWVFFFLMMGRLVDMYFGINGSIFTTSKKYRYDILFTIFLIVTVFLLNLVFIPKWGIAGAAISTSLALIVYNVGRILFVWFAFKIHPFHKNQFVVILLGLVSLFVGWLTADMIENKYVEFLVQSFYVLILFFVPIYWFKLEPETVNYFNKGTAFIGSKIGKQKA